MRLMIVFMIFCLSFSVNAATLEEITPEVQIIQDDGVHGIEVLKINKTCITLKPTVHDSSKFEYGQPIPFKIDEKLDGFVTTPGLFSKMPELEFCFDSLLEHKFSFGFNSTKIQVSIATYFNAYGGRLICRTKDDTVHIVWRNSTAQLVYARSTNNGSTWTHTRLQNTGTLSPPVMRCVDNNISIVYRNSSADDVLIFLSDNSGVSFQRKTAAITSGVIDHVDVIRRGTSINAFWKNTGSTIIYNRISTNNASSWSGSVFGVSTGLDPPASASQIQVDSPYSVINNSNMYMFQANLSSKENETDIFLFNSSNNGINWTRRKIIETSANGSRFVNIFSSVILNETNFYVLYVNRAIGNPKVNTTQLSFAQSTDSGTTWSTADIYNGSDTQEVREPMLAIDKNNRAWAFFIINSSSGSSLPTILVMNKTINDSSEWSSPTILDNLKNLSMQFAYVGVTVESKPKGDYLDIVYLNGTTLTYSQILLIALSPPPPSLCIWISGQNVTCDCASFNHTSGANGEYDNLNFTGSGTIHINTSDITYSNLYVDDQCIIDTDMDTILAAKETGG